MKKRFNTSLLEGEVSTQYTDMKGLAAIDGHEMTYLYQLCRDKGINMDEWYLLGLEIYDSEPIGGHDLTVTVMLIEKASKDESYDDLAKRIQQQPYIPVTKKSFTMPYQELGRYVKRLSIGMVSDMSQYIHAINFVE